MMDRENAGAGLGIGRLLEEAREGMGLSLWEVEQRTRIRSRYLRAIEREEFDVLPAVYVLGSLKTYADFLGLDGAALSRQLKASLVEPDEPDASARPAPPEDHRGEDQERDAPALNVGFDQLFVGAGVILISILAVMTLVAAVAQQEEAPVSQLDEPSTPDPPSEMALAGSTEDPEENPRPLRAADAPDAGDEDGERKKVPEASKKDENAEAGDKKMDRNSSQASSPFEGVEFVPVSPPPGPSASATAPAASASATATPAAPRPASPAPSSAAPATAEPEASPVPPAPAGTRTPPPDNLPAAAPAPSREPAAAPPQPAGGGGRPQPAAVDVGNISAEVDRRIDGLFQERGLD